MGGRWRGQEVDGPVASADIVQQEVTIGVDDLLAERLRHCERPGIDDSADRSRLAGGDVTDGTANLSEKSGSSLGVSGGRQNRVSGRDFRRPEETGEGIDPLMPRRHSMGVLRI